MVHSSSSSLPLIVASSAKASSTGSRSFGLIWALAACGVATTSSASAATRFLIIESSPGSSSGRCPALRQPAQPAARVRRRGDLQSAVSSARQPGPWWYCWSAESRAPVQYAPATDTPKLSPNLEKHRLPACIRPEPRPVVPRLPHPGRSSSPHTPRCPLCLLDRKSLFIRYFDSFTRQQQ